MLTHGRGGEGNSPDVTEREGAMTGGTGGATGRTGITGKTGGKRGGRKGGIGTGCIGQDTATLTKHPAGTRRLIRNGKDDPTTGLEIRRF